jgi:outer membrane lipoprotein-sorting protein
LNKNLFHPWARGLGLIAILCVTAGGAHAADLEQVLAEFDAVQNSIQTLSAEFTETTVNSMLKDPIVAEGEFYLTKPDAIRWEYSAPEEMRFVIARDQYTGYFPSQKRAEQRNIKRWSDQLFRFFGLGQGSTELAKFYRLGLEQGDAVEAGTYLLLLEPKKRRARKRVEEVRFWLDESTYLPRRVEYRGNDGNVRTLEFQTISVNPELAAGLYTVELPDDVTVTKGFSGLPNFTPAAQ